MRESAPRKGATRAADIPADVLNALSHGKLQSATLVEGLALDQAVLLRTVFPDLSPRALEATDAACQLGILKRMAGIGAALLHELGPTGIAQCQAHASDTVRGWACFMIGAQPGPDLSTRLTAIQPLADDAHFGVREWAWMAVRPHLTRQLDTAIECLAAWAVLPSERLRRFASEALRPRGVWCAHIAALKQQPEQALPILLPLRADPSTYVQDSVANWLNDAARDQPDWVRNLCAQWLQGEPADATHRICQRAQRNLK
ncbi:DNA alkylation repair protein [Halomonas sp. Y3]|uniref:DNA alkylation repair protein n=1 Tax=Halomonas sp. Y3 TaxID=2956797 RepID=UPI00209E745D|nr:DNA alkylation repair protein [Halomonas sp. Y3]